MGTVATSTNANPLSLPNTSVITRDMTSGTGSGWLYVPVRTGTDTVTFYRSQNDGGSWASMGSFTHTGLQEWSCLQPDRYGYAHIVYRVGTSGGGGTDAIYYRRVNLMTSTVGGAVLASALDTNGGTIGSRWQGVDLTVHKKSSNAYYVVWVGGYTSSTGQQGCALGAVTVTESGTVTISHNQIISGNRFWLATTSGRVGPTMELEHTGNGIAPASTPNLWISFGRTKLQLVKMAWNGNGWTGPTGTVTIKSTITAHDYNPARWDGTRFLQAFINPDDTSTVVVAERNQSNSLTTVLAATPVHPTGAVRHLALTYDATTKDVRVYAVGTSTDVLYFVTWDRSGGTWTSWATVTATAVLGSGTEWSVRRGGSAGNIKYDVVTAHAGSPNTIVHTAQPVTSAPSIPTWETSAQPYVNGGPADVGAALTLDWVFFTPDPGIIQGSYALSRQIGAGALAYWNAGTTTWVAGEVQNATATSSVTLSSGWGADVDPPYTYRVKVWDSVGTPSADYSPQLQLNPSTKVNPAITAPTAAQVIGVDQVAVAWTAAQQTSRRLRLLTNPPGYVWYDSGFVTTTDLAFTIPNHLDTGTSWTIELTTKNNEGLASTTQTRNFTVAYVSPPAPISTLTALPASGVIRVTASQLAVVGAQPSTVAMSLYRRPNVTPVLNANPTFAGNVTGWGIGGGGTPGTLTYSTAQFHEGPGAARYVPNAAGAVEPTVEMSTVFVITAGLVYKGSAWIRPDTATKPLKIQLNWYDAGNALISGSFREITNPVAGAWHYIDVYADPVPNAVKVTVAVGERSTPAAVDAFYVDEAKLQVYNASDGVRLADGLAPASIVDDIGPASGVDYEYRWSATGANGTSLYGPWTV